MPKVSTVLNQLRAEHIQDSVLTIDCGDHMDRMRMETEGSNGEANVEIMNHTGYEAFVLGNNEGLTFTPQMLSELFEKHTKFPVIGSNLHDMSTGTQPPWMVPYHIVRKGEMNIGLIGVTAHYEQFYRLLGWKSIDPIETIARIVAELTPQVDIIVVMSHLGLSLDQKIAEKILGIDCIFGGHTHHLLEQPIRIGDTYICAAGKFGQYVGELELHYDVSKKTVLYASGRCVDVSDALNDIEIERIIRKHQDESQQRLEQVYTVIDSSLPIDWSDESPLGNLLAAGVRKWTEADIGLINSGQILQGFEAGPVTRGKLLQACPSPINPCRYLLTGANIRQALEESLLEEFTQLPIRGFGFRGKVLGNLCVDGLTIEYNTALNSYEQITGVWVNGEPLIDTKEYVVGTLDMFTFKIGYTSLAKGRETKFYLPEFIRDVLHKELMDTSAVVHSFTKRWRAKY